LILIKEKELLQNFLTPFISESIGTERAVDVTVRGGKTSEGKLIYYPNDNADVIIGNSLKTYFWRINSGSRDFCH